MYNTKQMSGYKDLELAVEHRLRYGDHDSLLNLIRRYESMFPSDVNQRILRKLRVDYAAAHANNSWSDVILTSQRDFSTISQTLQEIGFLSNVSMNYNIATPINQLRSDPEFGGLIVLYPSHTLWHCIFDRVRSGSVIAFRPNKSQPGILCPYDVQPKFVTSYTQPNGRTPDGNPMVLRYDAETDELVLMFRDRDPARCDLTLFHLLVDTCFITNSSPVRVLTGDIKKNALDRNVGTLTANIGSMSYAQLRPDPSLKGSYQITPGDKYGDIDIFTTFVFGQLDYQWLIKDRLEWSTSTEFIKRVRSYLINPLQFKIVARSGNYMIESILAAKPMGDGASDFFHCDNFTLQAF